MHINFPFQINNYGQVDVCDANGHLRDMMEQILFTMPGERVNRPDFGVGVQTMIFNSELEELITVKQSIIHSELQKYLGHLMHLENIHITGEDSRLNILIQYTAFTDGQKYEAKFTV